MRALLTALSILALLTAGCLGSDSGTAPGSKTTDKPLGATEAPWWKEGDYFTFEVSRNGEAPRTQKLVTFDNDSKTAHFWLGVADRNLALEHALYDTNPLLGRIHYYHLSPHERGMHAVMYSWPLEDGKTFDGSLFDRNWSMKVKADTVRTPKGSEPGYVVTGTSPDDGASIRYNYVPSVKWFTELEVKSANGKPLLSAKLKESGTDAKGTYHFLRGRDFYKRIQDTASGTREDPVEVGEDVNSLAVKLDLKTSGPLQVQLLDPSGRVQYSGGTASPTGGTVKDAKEIPTPARGTWTLRYVATGSYDGDALVIGLIEYKGTL
ncbi:MAG TPA: hypothetical protein VNZ52_02820 [Candidatus Thermoplasmatota archaeon]|nr:hypothetical protein [Candidatus Thermoplasmatota archaeon]